MDTVSYYQPVRTCIACKPENRRALAEDLARYGLHDHAEATGLEELEQEMYSSMDIEVATGNCCFYDTSATCGEDVNDLWLEHCAPHLLANSLPGSFFEVCDTACHEGCIGVFRYERTLDGTVKREYRDFANPFEGDRGRGGAGCPPAPSEEVVANLLAEQRKSNELLAKRSSSGHLPLGRS